MSKSKLLKEAIADAKAVRETAIANAKIALEEAFTPRLQSILSRKLQAEMEEEEEIDLGEEFGAEDVEAEDSSGIGAGEGGTGSGTDGAEPEGEATYAHTELDPETEEETAEVGAEDEHMPVAEGDDDEFDFEDEMEDEDEDELDLEAIIRELEGEDEELHSEEEEYTDPTGATMEEEEHSDNEAEIAELKARIAELEGSHSDEEMEFDLDEEEIDFEEEEIDLDEILREMGYGDDEEVSEEEHEDEVHNEEEAAHVAELEAELEEAYKAIKSLRGTINEVNLLNAKLLYTNKLFRNYNLTNEQKVKVVENLDRTSNVREVKLVYATLSESMKFTGTEKKASIKKTVTEGLASKKSASTAPKKEIINESADTIADRFKKLAGII